MKAMNILFTKTRHINDIYFYNTEFFYVREYAYVEPSMKL